MRLIESISLDHVMARSAFNLHNARMAVLSLSSGSIEELTRYTEAAKRDFRDVIYWVTRDGD